MLHPTLTLLYIIIYKVKIFKRYVKNKKTFIDNCGFSSQYCKNTNKLYKIKNEPSLATITLTQNFCPLLTQKTITTKKRANALLRHSPKTTKPTKKRISTAKRRYAVLIQKIKGLKT
jgi:hypothetical protein